MDNKNKILVFHHSGAIGGGGVSMLHILKIFKSSGYNIKVICPSEPKYMMEEIKKLGISAIAIFDKRWVYPHYNGEIYNEFDPRFLKKRKFIKNSYDTIKKIIDNENPDIIVLNSMTIAWMVNCIDKNIKTICFDRETLPHNGQGKRCGMIKNWLSKMTKTIYISEYDRLEAGAHPNSCVICDKVDMIKFENMIDRMQAKRALGLDISKKHILFAGGMWDVKGSHIAIETMKYLDEYELLFLQYTPSKQKHSIKSTIKNILGLNYEAETLKKLEGVEDRVKFFPAQKDMIPFYSACDIVIFPSILPHQARPVYEAGVAKRPVVISDFENTNEFAQDNINALTFKPGNAKELAGCIKKLEDKKLYYKLSENGYKMCQKNHDLNNMDSEIKKMLESIEG